LNYYRRYVGDYLRDTSRLSMLEHGAYTLLLDYYYADELPLPIDRNEIYTMVRAMTPADRKAVDKVLDRYFVLADDGYRNNRADEELGVATVVIEASRENGKKGGRPKTQKQTHNETQTQTQKETQNITQSKTQTETKTVTREEPTNNHPPTTNHHPPASSLQPPAKQQRANAVAGSKNEDVAQLAGWLRAAGLTGANPENPKLIQLAESGVTEAVVAEAVRIARTDRGKGEKPFHFSYIIGIISDLQHPQERADPWWLDDNKTLAKAKEVGVSTIGKLKAQVISEVHEAIRKKALAAPDRHQRAA
jgi:uncharacterized protein YdaU (DUF1376 family)